LECALRRYKLAAAEKKFSASLPPIEALRAWMLQFVDYIATKQIIGPAGEARNQEPRHS
jgi:hypothetical protein